MALSLATLLPIVYGVKELAKDEALSSALVSIAIGLAFGTWFVVGQLRLLEPLLDVRLFAVTALGGVYLLLWIRACRGSSASERSPPAEWS
nr:hypothetical protein [Streptosporangium sp. 'caverna']